MHTRPSTPADRSFLRFLHHAAYRDVVIRQFGSWDDRAQDEWFEKGLVEAETHVVEESGSAVGAIRVASPPNCLPLVELQILPEWQNRGLGTALIEQQLNEARTRRLPIRLQVLR